MSDEQLIKIYYKAFHSCPSTSPYDAHMAGLRAIAEAARK